MKPNRAEHERGYVEGHRRAALSQLAHALRELAPFESSAARPPEVAAARLVLERQETVAMLRALCERLDLSQDWPDELHLGDVVEKHVVRVLEGRFHDALAGKAGRA